jgi:hypothetical protein
MLTDVPIGCWTSANVLDLIGGRSSRRAAQRLMGLGILSAVPTAVTGLAEFSGITDSATRRVAAVHAAANSAALACYVGSWMARRSGSPIRGTVLGLLGTGAASVGGFLGGHLAFAMGAGVGERGADTGSAQGDARGDSAPGSSGGGNVDLRGSTVQPSDGDRAGGEHPLPANSGPAGDAVTAASGDIVA